MGGSVQSLPPPPSSQKSYWVLLHPPTPEECIPRLHFLLPTQRCDTAIGSPLQTSPDWYLAITARSRKLAVLTSLCAKPLAPTTPHPCVCPEKASAQKNASLVWKIKCRSQSIIYRDYTSPVCKVNVFFLLLIKRLNRPVSYKENPAGCLRFLSAKAYLFNMTQL